MKELKRSENNPDITGWLIISWTGLGWHEFWVFHCLPNSAWAVGNFADLAWQMGKMVEHPTQSQPNPGSRTDEMMNHPVSRQCNPHHEAAVVGRDGEVCQARDRLAALHQGSAPLRGELELGRVPRSVLHAGDLHARAVGHHLQDRHVCLSLDASRNTLMSK